MVAAQPADGGRNPAMGFPPSHEPTAVSRLIVVGCSPGQLPVGLNRAGGDRLPYLSTVAPGRAWQKGGFYGR